MKAILAEVVGVIGGSHASERESQVPLVWFLRRPSPVARRPLPVSCCPFPVSRFPFPAFWCLVPGAWCPVPGAFSHTLASRKEVTVERLTSYSHGAGCACKLAPGELGQGPRPFYKTHPPPPPPPPL